MNISSQNIEAWFLGSSKTNKSQKFSGEQETDTTFADKYNT